MSYIGKSPSGTGVRSRFYFTQSSGGGTSISGTDDNSKTLTFTDGEYIDVYLNGVLLVAGTDYNTTTANTVAGLAALASGDVVEVVVYDIFTVADTVSATQGGTFQGNVVFNGTTTGLDLNGTELVLDADADTSITADTDDRIDFKTGGTDAMHIDGSQNVGIGTAAPDNLLTISGGDSGHSWSYDSGDLLIIEDNDSASINIATPAANGANILFSDADARGQGRIAYTHSSDKMEFMTGGVSNTRIAIASDGAVGIGQTSPDSLLKVKAISGLTGNAKLSYFYDDQNRLGNYRQNAHASFDSSMSLHYTERAANSAYNFLIMSSGGASDTEFSFRGDGNGFCDGSFSGGGADYAEYFEWDDGNSSDEDRRGYSVVLVGNKIRKATSSDAASDIIGVVSATPAMVGDAAWDRWEGKYLTDDYGAYLKEAYTATQWTETDVDGVETPRYYETDKIPADVTVPSDAVVTSTETDGSLLMRRRLNPDYDDTQTYTPREERQEWDTIGLMGKLRLRAGQPTGDRWIKMRDIATDDDGNVTVEEWLVR